MITSYILKILPIVIDESQLLNDILNVSGILLGLSFAAITYILQNAYASFQHSKNMFLKIYTKSGNRILYSLSFTLLLSFIMKNFNIEMKYLLFMGIIIQIIAVKLYLDYYSYLGYINTLFSNKLIPQQYGSFRSYFRKINNNKFLTKLNFFVGFIIFYFIPLLLIHDVKYKTFLYYLSVSILISAIFQIAFFISQLSNLQELEFRNILPDGQENDRNPHNIDYRNEKLILKKYLQEREIVFDKYFTLDNFNIVLYLLNNDSSEAWINIYLDNITLNPMEIREAVEEHSIRLFLLLESSECDINGFVLSYHIKLDKTRNIFYRSNRNEIKSFKLLPSIDCIKKINNKLYDALFMEKQE